MKKLIAIFALTVIATVSISAQSAGGSVSVFLPESLLLGEGSASIETGFSTSVGLGSIVSVPVGFSYIQAYGLLPDGGPTASAPWVYADSLLLHGGLRAGLGFGRVSVFAGAGGALNWMPVARVLLHNVATDLAIGETVVAFDPDTVETKVGLGLGWYAETGTGFRLTDQLALTLRGRLYIIPSDFSLNATMFTIERNTESNEPSVIGKEFKSADEYESLRVVLRALSISLGGSFSF
ncbi:MAG: hypothetical protein EA426_14340 [Spirochaetaceae bacterium]|nr:MAG: hypothetical protein EA426_14340 [Spirochaetaceae bacterium]